MIVFPDFSQINRADSADLCGYAHLIFSTINKNNGFMMNQEAFSAELSGVCSNAQLWVKRIENNIEDIDIHYLPEILSWFEIIHRIVRNVGADKAFITKWNSYYSNIMFLSGDMELKYASMFRYCQQKRAFPDSFIPSIDNKYQNILTGWKNENYSELSLKGIRILSCLLLANNHKLVEIPQLNCRNMIKQGLRLLDDIRYTDSKSLLSLMNLFVALQYYINDRNQYCKYYKAIHSSLISSEELNQWHKLAYAIDNEML